MKPQASESAAAGGKETGGSSDALPVGLQEKLKAELGEAGSEGEVSAQAVVAEGFPNGLND